MLTTMKPALTPRLYRELAWGMLALFPFATLVTPDGKLTESGRTEFKRALEMEGYRGTESSMVFYLRSES